MNFESQIKAFTELVLNPKVCINNYPIEWVEKNELGEFKFEEDETSISYNGINTKSDYRSLLNTLQNKILQSLNFIAENHSIASTDNTVEIFRRLIHPNELIISHKYEIEAVSKKLEFLVEQRGGTVLLKVHNEELIKELDNIGISLYEEQYKQLENIITKLIESRNTRLKSSFDMNDIDKFLDILFQTKQDFYLDLTYVNENLETVPALYFCGFDNPKSFQEYCNKLSIKTIFEFSNRFALHKINTDFILNHIERLQNSLNSYELPLGKVEQIIPRPYSIDNYMVIPADSISIKELGEEHVANFFLYNKIKYKTIISLIAKFFKILNPEGLDLLKTPKVPQNKIASEKLTGIAFAQEHSDILLYEIYKLWNKRIIETDFVSFRMAFTGQLLNHSPQIKWLVLHRKNPSHTSLINFLYSGIFEDIEEDKELIKVVINTFCDITGNSFILKSFQTSLKDYNKRQEQIDKSNQPWKRTIDNIIQKTNCLTNRHN